MKRNTKFAVFLAVSLSLLLALSSFGWAGSSETTTTVAAPSTTTTTTTEPTPYVDPWLGLQDAIAERDRQIAEYVEAVEFAQAVAYVEAVERAEAEERARQEATERAERERREREAAAAAETQEKATRAASQPAAPPVARQSSGGSCGGWESLIAKHFSDVGTACRVMMCESGGNPNALNGNPKYQAAGLFQIIKQWASKYQQVTGLPYYDGRFDPNANVMFAAFLVRDSGWASQFDCY